MAKKHISYSDLLQKFIEPILDDSDDVDGIIAKAKIGKVAWNYALMETGSSKLFDVQQKLLSFATALSPEGEKVLNQLILRKETHFRQYTRMIDTVEKREKPDGSITLYVESYETQPKKS